MGGQAEVQAKFEEEFAAYEAGLYREQPRDWLATSWQGDALQVIPHAIILLCRQPPTLSRHPRPPCYLFEKCFCTFGTIGHSGVILIIVTILRRRYSQIGPLIP